MTEKMYWRSSRQEICNRNGLRVNDESSLHEMILFVFYTAKVHTALKGDAKKTVTRIILSEKKEMDDLNKEVESENRKKKI